MICEHVSCFNGDSKWFDSIFFLLNFDGDSTLFSSFYDEVNEVIYIDSVGALRSYSYIGYF